MLSFNAEPIKIGRKYFTPNIEGGTVLIENKCNVWKERQAMDTLPDELIYC